MDENDPLALRKGDEVEVWPTDSGFGVRHRDRGVLLRLTSDEAVIAVSASAGEGARGAGVASVRLAVPRWGFKITRAGGGGGVAARL